MRWLKTKWCSLFHDAVMLPVSGVYRCRVCQCETRVQWEEKRNG